MTESIFGRLAHLITQRKEIKTEAAPYPKLEQERPVNPVLFKYFFDTQAAIEKEGAMDYRKYASRVWQQLVAGQPQKLI